MAEKYFYGQGRILISPYGSNNYRWVGDVSALALTLGGENVEHRESHSGQKGLARRFSIGKDGTISMTMHQLDANNLSLVLHGAASTIPASSGDVTHSIPTGAAVGDIIQLPHISINDASPNELSIEDSAGTPATLTRGTHYSVDLVYGTITLLNLGSFVFPLIVTYRHFAQDQVAMFTSGQPEVSLVYEGINLAESNAAVRVELYRVSTDPLEELALINNETEVNGMTVNGGLLVDTSKPVGGSLGQFGRIIEPVAA